MSEHTKVNAREVWKYPIDSRRVSESQLWIVGCSLAHGYGLAPEQRYGDIVARELDIQVSWLTLPGSSIDWAADQILRADIRQGDTIIWGITGVNRRVWFKNGEIRRLCTGTVFSDDNWMFIIQEPAVILEQKSYLMELLMDPANVYYAQRSIMQVQSVCEKLGIRLLTMFHREMSSESDSKIIIDHLSSHKDNIVLDLLHDVYQDRAPEDPSGHPGPETNRYWSDKILTHLRNAR